MLIISGGGGILPCLLMNSSEEEGKKKMGFVDLCGEVVGDFIYDDEEEPVGIQSNAKSWQKLVVDLLIF